ncbi:flagellin FliC [Aliidiomarina minuta]|uniref:Flagellin n=1 Tax=Aliidiomarina minuta TaxID=880057 RepID=A0A432W8D5_9GAMM|nr:flagellin [Aliidiomarina minuta]RUO26387.1 flagellin FliC [Aliidiomarina minuta]
MALYVNTNISSLNAQRQLLLSSIGLNTSFQRLSSGFRINSAADDAAGLQISTRMTSQINGLNQAVRNAYDGISVAQVAEGSMQEVTNMLQRMRELVIQSDNGINSAEDRTAIQSEITELQSEIDRIASTTQFSGRNLLDGSLATDGLSFLAGTTGAAAERISMTIASVAVADLGVDLGAVDVTEAAANDVADMLSAIDNAIGTVGSSRASLGAKQNRFQSTINNLSNISENISAARSRIMDTDYAAETAKLVRFQIMQQASVAILAQANQRPSMVLSLLG